MLFHTICLVLLTPLFFYTSFSICVQLNILGSTIAITVMLLSLNPMRRREGEMFSSYCVSKCHITHFACLLYLLPKEFVGEFELPSSYRNHQWQHHPQHQHNPQSQLDGNSNISSNGSTNGSSNISSNINSKACSNISSNISSNDIDEVDKECFNHHPYLILIRYG